MVGRSIILEILWMISLSFYVIFVAFYTKKIFERMKKKGISDQEAIYFNRKLVHIFAGGIVAILVPFVFSSSFYPLFCGLSITVLTYISHIRGNKFYWFQTSENQNDVSFCFMWGISIFILWELTQNPWISVLPALYIAVGDGITGIVRNILFKKRSKHPIGNMVMAIVCLPIGYLLGALDGIGFGGIISALVASIMERFEIGPIDDNVLITFSSMIVILLFSSIF